MMERKISILDKIGSLIPGYAGYADRDSRRNCDKIIRDKIATYILNCEATLNDKMNIEIKNKNFIILDEIEQCRKKLNTLSEKIKYAPYGESSFFGDLQIKEAELLKIYQLDDKILSFVVENENYISSFNFESLVSFIKSLKFMIDEREAFIKEHR